MLQHLLLTVHENMQENIEMYTPSVDVLHHSTLNHVHMYMCVCACEYIHACLYVYVCVYMCTLDSLETMQDNMQETTEMYAREYGV